MKFAKIKVCKSWLEATQPWRYGSCKVSQRLVQIIYYFITGAHYCIIDCIGYTRYWLVRILCAIPNSLVKEDEVTWMWIAVGIFACRFSCSISSSSSPRKRLYYNEYYIQGFVHKMHKVQRIHREIWYATTLQYPVKNGNEMGLSRGSKDTDRLDVFALTFKTYEIHFSKTMPRQKL